MIHCLLQDYVCEAQLMVDQLEFPSTGPGPRNLSEWIAATDVNVEYFRTEKGKEKVRIPPQEKRTHQE